MRRFIAECSWGGPLPVGDERSVSGLVSVVIPCYNQARFLDECLTSVELQEEATFEIIVVDDGSTDDIEPVLTRHPGVQYLRQANAGTSRARNRGIGVARGEYVVVLDADDRLLAGALASGVAALRAASDAVMAWGDCRFISASGVVIEDTIPELNPEDAYAMLLGQCLIPHPACVVFRRSLFKRGVSFDETLSVCSDYDFYLKVLRADRGVAHTAVVSDYRQHDDNKSLNNERQRRDLRRIIGRQAEWVRDTPRLIAASRAGLRNADEYLWRRSVHQVRKAFGRGGSRRHLAANARLAIRLAPFVAPRVLFSWLLKNRSR